MTIAIIWIILMLGAWAFIYAATKGDHE